MCQEKGSSKKSTEYGSAVDQAGSKRERTKTVRQMVGTTILGGRLGVRWPGQDGMGWAWTWYSAERDLLRLWYA